MSTSFVQAILPKGLPSSITRAASRILGFGQAENVYRELRGQSPPLWEGLLQYMQVTCRVTPADLHHIPRKGPAVLVANHPFGILEAAVLVTAVRQIRGDARILANQLMSSFPELQDLVIPVDIGNGLPRSNLAPVRQAVQFLAGGGLLIVFPAGAVSHFQWRERASVDPPWNAAVAKLIALTAKESKTSPVVVPVFVPGANSLAFHLAGMMHPGLRTALLARELFNKKGTTVDLRIGSPIRFEKLAAMPSDQERIQYLRWRTYLLANRNSFKPETRFLRRRRAVAVTETVVPAAPASILAGEVDRLPPQCLLDRTGALAVYLSAAGQIPELLREIGRLREITFRQEGEGTGRPIDLDRFDEHYLHLFVWNAEKQEVVGAYRLQATDRTPALYTRTLFRFDERFLNTIGPAVELGRSFIRAEYQKGFAPLLLLWKGIGKFIAANPRYRILFGPVSISNRYQAVSREIMIAYLEKRASVAEWVNLVRARNAPPNVRADVRCGDVDELSDVISDLEPAQSGIPVLLRQYLKLGGKLIGFNVDPEFSDVLDGLIVVDLTKTEPRLLARYLGPEAAAYFLEFQKEIVHGT